MSTLGSVVLRDVIANLPAASIPGRVFYSTDTLQIMRDNGTTWDNVTPAAASPTGAANLVLATPNGSTGAATLRALVVADVPTLNQNTTGNAATATNALGVGGVTVTGTPTSGDVLTATSGTAASWAAGGGGSSVQTAYLNSNLSPATSTSPFCHKGLTLQPRQVMTISAVWALLLPTAGQTYVASVATASALTGTSGVTVSSSPTISSAITIPTLTGSNGGYVWFRIPLASPVSLVAGTNYVITVGLTSATATTSCPISYPTPAVATLSTPFPAFFGVSARIAANPPVSGSAIDTNTGVISGVHMAFEWV